MCDDEADLQRRRGLSNVRNRNHLSDKLPRTAYGAMINLNFARFARTHIHEARGELIEEW